MFIFEIVSHIVYDIYYIMLYIYIAYCRVFQDIPEIFIMLCPTKNVILRSPLFTKHSLYFISCWVKMW